MSTVSLIRVLLVMCTCMFVSLVFSARVVLTMTEAVNTKETTVAINSQPCTLPTSTNNEVQINER